MFEAGKQYVMATIDAEVGGELQKWAIYKVEGPTFRTQIDGRVVVLNTRSPKFVRAGLLASN